jgi:hypothetical protein
MLTAVPKNWFSWDFTVMDGSQAVAEIEVSSWREKGILTIQSVDYRVYKKSVMSGVFILESSGAVMARAKKPSAFRRSFILDHGGSQYTLRAASFFGSEFLLLDGDREIGSLSQKGVFSRRIIVNLPAELPLPLRVFIIWLTVILLKRTSNSAAVIAGT